MAQLPPPNTQPLIPGTRRLAVLIDGDNAQPSLVEPMFAALAAYGQPIVRRIYGDWSRVQMRGWLEAMAQFAFQPRQHFPAASGKNSTDIALIIDTMDLLYANEVDGFCIVSSDSDYTPLASRIREGGGFVIGIGKRMTPDALVRVCDVFLFSEDLLPPGAQDEPSLGPPPRPRRRTAVKKPRTPENRVKDVLLDSALVNSTPAPPSPAAPAPFSFPPDFFGTRLSAPRTSDVKTAIETPRTADSPAALEATDSAEPRKPRTRSKRAKTPDVQTAAVQPPTEDIPVKAAPAAAAPAESAPRRRRTAKSAAPEPIPPAPDAAPIIATSKSSGRRRTVAKTPKIEAEPAAPRDADGAPPKQGAEESPWRLLGDPETLVRPPRVKAAPGSKPDPRQVKRIQPVPSAFFDLFQQAFELAVRPDGWAQLSALSNRLHQIDPEFKPRTYGYSRLSQLVEAYPEHFELKPGGGDSHQVYVRPRKNGYWRAN